MFNLSVLPTLFNRSQRSQLASTLKEQQSYRAANIIVNKTISRKSSDAQLTGEFSSPAQNNSWSLWIDHNSSYPQICRLCHDSQRFVQGNLVVLNLKTIEDYCAIPSFLWDRYLKNELTVQAFSDIVRSYILKDQGGYWFDSTVYLCESIPSDILLSEVFFFRLPAWPLVTVNIRHYSSWFIKASTDSPLMNLLCRSVEEYFTRLKRPLHYYWFHHLVTAIMASQYGLAIAKQMPYYDSTASHYLYDYISACGHQTTHEKCKRFMGASFMHKLSYSPNGVANCLCQLLRGV